MFIEGGHTRIATDHDRRRRTKSMTLVIHAPLLLIFPSTVYLCKGKGDGIRGGSGIVFLPRGISLDLY